MKRRDSTRSGERVVASDGAVRVRRAYFDCRFGQLNVRTAFPGSGGFDERTTLLCVHPESTSGRWFARFLPEIAHDRSVYAPDLPGCGESDPPPQRPSIADYAAALVDFVATMRFRRVDVLGCRTGALIAIELALAIAQSVRRLVLVSVPQVGGVERAASVMRPAATEEANPLLHNGPAAQWMVAAVREYPLGERLPLVRQPTLHLRPRDDTWDHAAQVRRLLHGARSVDLAELGADLFSIAPQTVAQQVRTFLDAS